MEEVASLRPVSLIYLSYMPDSIFHFCLTRFNLPVKSTISGEASNSSVHVWKSKQEGKGKSYTGTVTPH